MSWRWLRTVFPLSALLFVGCGSEEGEKPGTRGECVSTDRFFAEEIWQPFMGSQCFSCHNVQGTARDSRLILLPPQQPDYLRINLERVRELSRYQLDGVSLLLLKPTERVEHGGGKQLDVKSAHYQALEELVRRFEEPVICNDGGSSAALSGLEILDPVETLRRASLGLVGRIPTEEETFRVEAGGEKALAGILDEMMTEQAFFDRVMEFWNDLLLTDRYVGWERALQLLDGNDYPNRYWYKPPEGEEGDEQEIGRHRLWSNTAVAKEPLQLIAHVVKNHRPFTEILTARYRMVTPYSARSYGVDKSVRFDDPTNPDEWKETTFAGIEQAGVLTSPMFLNRFPTTATNRNRARARMVFRFFLATDLLKLADRPLDPSNIEDFNPTMYNPECTVCHTPMDPVAGAFQNWDDRGRYRPPENGWHTDMRPPGFGEKVVPHGERGRSLEWLGEQIASDPLFVTATVQNAWTLLTGQPPLVAPADPVGGRGQQKAFEAQSEHFREVGAAFVASGHDFKELLKELILGPWYRAAGIDPDNGGNEALAFVDSGRLLSPEALDRKIESVTGYPWKSSAGGSHYLTELSQYRIFYGGIDSEGITERIRAPNGIMASVQMRMANEMACRSVARDFSLDAADRRLFPYVELAYEPEDANGFPVPGAIDAIKENIRALHQRVLGEELFPGDPEIERTFGIFYDTWKEGRSALAEEKVGTWLHWQCASSTDWWTGEDLPEERRVQRDPRYTVRSWMAVMTYLLLDGRFLYE